MCSGRFDRRYWFEFFGKNHKLGKIGKFWKKIRKSNSKSFCEHLTNVARRPLYLVSNPSSPLCVRVFPLKVPLFSFRRLLSIKVLIYIYIYVYMICISVFCGFIQALFPRAVFAYRLSFPLLVYPCDPHYLQVPTLIWFTWKVFDIS